MIHRVRINRLLPDGTEKQISTFRIGGTQPTTAKMNTCYGLNLGKHVMAVADLVAPNELTPGWTITRINVPEG